MVETPNKLYLPTSFGEAVSWCQPNVYACLIDYTKAFSQVRQATNRSIGTTKSRHKKYANNCKTVHKSKGYIWIQFVLLRRNLTLLAKNMQDLQNEDLERSRSSAIVAIRTYRRAVPWDVENHMAKRCDKRDLEILRKIEKSGVIQHEVN